ncbi:MAG: F510_1955 family glycosylhydrolase, partial [Acidimicrobiales bacterium]
MAAVVVALPILVWAATRGSGGDGSSAGDPGVSHVHGLGVNPADGSLHVATHHGTFRIQGDDPAERVGDSYQDTMGFTVAGPDRFLGSGHPDVQGFRQGQPRLLGLIESTNAGESWSAVSLSGEVDFHALAFAHGRTYGWDSTSGRFMVSSDQ